MSFVIDLFTETADTPLEDHIGELGADWTLHPSYPTSLLQVSGGNDWLERQASDAGSVAYYASGIPDNNAQNINADLSRLNSSETSLGITGRMSTTANTMYYARYTQVGHKWNLFKIVAGVATSLGQHDLIFGLPETKNLKVDLKNTSKKMFIDDVEVISNTDNEITDIGRVGVLWGMTAVGVKDSLIMDNFRALISEILGTPDERAVSIGSDNRIIAIGENQ